MAKSLGYPNYSAIYWLEPNADNMEFELREIKKDSDINKLRNSVIYFEHPVLDPISAEGVEAILDGGCVNLDSDADSKSSFHDNYESAEDEAYKSPPDGYELSSDSDGGENKKENLTGGFYNTTQNPPSPPPLPTVPPGAVTDGDWDIPHAHIPLSTLPSSKRRPVSFLPPPPLTLRSCHPQCPIPPPPLICRRRKSSPELCRAPRNPKYALVTSKSKVVSSVILSPQSIREKWKLALAIFSHPSRSCCRFILGELGGYFRSKGEEYFYFGQVCWV
ncbi:hypothetical protein PIB30_061209 [Stylosanthes scabra]|uniref:Uncharacterized protein n=1 Tax=Stylosanthes scabra TaxID=79078 RepID=A0ABU6YLB9_9FABA|nr:hypothetical protein [Stylosanthes scabra]